MRQLKRKINLKSNNLRQNEQNFVINNRNTVKNSLFQNKRSMFRVLLCRYTLISHR